MQKVLFSIIVGFLAGLLVATGVSFYINNAEIPFVDRFSEQEHVEVPSDWNPNASLQHGSTQVVNPPEPLTSSSRNTTGNVAPDTNPPAIAVGGGGGNTTTLPPTNLPAPTQPTQVTESTQANVQFYVQAGAFSARQDAEQQRARLALAGAQATISQSNVAGGQSVHRVRVGPYGTRAEAQAVMQKLSSNGINATIVGS